MEERKTLSEHEILTTSDAEERARRGVVDADGEDDTDSDSDGTDAGSDSDDDGTDSA